jgi:hypothetical protein
MPYDASWNNNIISLLKLRAGDAKQTLRIVDAVLQILRTDVSGRRRPAIVWPASSVSADLTQNSTRSARQGRLCR